MDDHCVLLVGCTSPGPCDVADACLAAGHNPHKNPSKTTPNGESTVRNRYPRTYTELGRMVRDNAPKNATGVYIVGNQLVYGKRTNRKKRPPNYIWFDELT